jgi:hypothetical protein
MYDKRYEALRCLGRPEAQQLRSWVGRDDQLVRSVWPPSRGAPAEIGPLLRDEYQRRGAPGQIGRLLLRAQAAPELQFSPAAQDPAALDRLDRRLQAFDMKSPLRSTAFKSLAPAELRKSL